MDVRINEDGWDDFLDGALRPFASAMLESGAEATRENVVADPGIDTGDMLESIDVDEDADGLGGRFGMLGLPDLRALYMEEGTRPAGHKGIRARHYLGNAARNLRYRP